MKNFPNGFESWAETHHEVVSAITLTMNQDEYPIKLEEIQLSKGSGGIWEFCIELTDEFEKLNEGREWDGEFYDEIEEFINSKIN
jgi:hypothetical protein